MRMDEVEEEVVDEVKASKKLCKSSIPNHKLGASQLASCKSQGLRAREGKKTARIGGKVTKLSGKKVKSKAYGGPVPSYD